MTMHNGITIKSDIASLKKETFKTVRNVFLMVYKSIRSVPFLQLTRILQVFYKSALVRQNILLLINRSATWEYTCLVSINTTWASQDWGELCL